MISTKAHEVPNPVFSRGAYHERNVVERLISFLNQWRQIAARDEKRVVT